MMVPLIRISTTASISFVRYTTVTENLFTLQHLSQCKGCRRIWLASGQSHSNRKGQWCKTQKSYQLKNVCYKIIYHLRRIPRHSTKALAGTSGTPGRQFQARSLTNLPWPWYHAAIFWTALDCIQNIESILRWPCAVGSLPGICDNHNTHMQVMIADKKNWNIHICQITYMSNLHDRIWYMRL